MTREDWLEERKKGIGGSDAATILGLNPYKTSIDLWEEKTGRKDAEDISEISDLHQRVNTAIQINGKHCVKYKRTHQKLNR